MEEVRLILEDLYFRWFEAIYNDDEKAVREVVATPERLSAFEEMTQSHSYPRPPDESSVSVYDVEILLDSPTCLVALATLDLTTWLNSDTAISTGVDVMWPHEDSWRRATIWGSKDDLWEDDCETARDDELP